MIVSAWRKLRCLSVCQKYASSFTSFLRYYILKNPVIWLADIILAHRTGELEFCQIWDWWWNINNNISFQFTLFPKKTNDKSFQKIQKKPILVPFWVLSCPNLPTKKGCRFLNIPIIYHRAKNLKKLNPLLRKMPNWRTERWTDGRTDGQTDRQTDNGDFFRTSCNGGPMCIS